LSVKVIQELVGCIVLNIHNTVFASNRSAICHRRNNRRDVGDWSPDY